MNWRDFSSIPFLQRIFLGNPLLHGVFGSGGFYVNSAIHLTAVAHTVDAHDANLVGNFVHHTVVAHADAPVAFAAGEFAATGRARVVRESPRIAAMTRS